MKLIDEYLSMHSWSQFVNKIPDKSIIGGGNAAQVIITKEDLSQTVLEARDSRKYKKQIFDELGVKHKDIKNKMIELYSEMKNALNGS